MQYILTEEEMKSLVSKSKVEELENKIEKLNNLVLKSQNRGCIYFRSAFNCDDCPITFSCNKTKEYSK